MTRGLRAVAGLCILVAGCGDFLLPDDPQDGPTDVARALWTEVDEYYAYFDLKGVDWDAIGTANLPRVTPATTDHTLFGILTDMLEPLHDGHVVLDAPFDRFEWTDWYTAFPANYREGVAEGYLVSGSRGASRGGVVGWGRLGEHLGYLRIPDFARGDPGAAIDEALEALGPLDGIVIDIRNNPGGSDTRATAAAARFVLERAHYRTVRYKTGPGHEDFSPEIRSYVEPAGRASFGGPIVVLQNRRTYSAAEDFVLAMRIRPAVTFVGDRTGGGAGNPIWRELPNGWLVSISRWRSWAADGTDYEGTGLAPDVAVDAPDAQLAAGRDRILERAVEVLGGG